MPGMHGNYTAVTAMQQSDLLVALGSRFDDRVTGKLDGFAPDAKIVHVDIDPAEIGKNRAVDVPIVGDCRDVIGKLAAELAKRQDEGDGVPDRSAWLTQLAEWQETYPYRYDQEAGRPAEAAVLRRAPARRSPTTTRSSCSASASTRCTRRSSGGSRSRVTGSTPAAWARWASRCRRRWARRSASPRKRVVAIDGDGCFQMTAQELATSATEKIPFVTAILNNGYLGMVRQWQELFFDERYSRRLAEPERAGLREARRGLRRGGPARRVARGGRRRHREGLLRDRPQRRHRLPRRPGARWSSRWCPRAPRTTTSSWGPRGVTPTIDPAEAPIA